MRKILVLILCLSFIFLFIGCKNNEVESNREAVVINLPKDSSVNGYRTEKPSNNDDIISAEDAIVVKDFTVVNETEGEYCVNKNSKVFHKPTCSSVSKMKDENKVLIKTKSEAVSKGYTACKVCNP